MWNGKLSGFWDNVNGGWLKPDKVRQARVEERCWMHAEKIYHKVPLTDCYRDAGNELYDLRWIDLNEGDDQNEVYRSRVTVREIKAMKEEHEKLSPSEIFSSSPPLEALVMMCSLLATFGVTHNYKIAMFGISRANFY